MIRTLLAAFSLAAVLASPALASDKDDAKAARKFDKKFREVVQPLQYDGDYSPAAGRLPDPEPSATVPVRFVPAWKRQIPVIVAPAPRYVDEQTLNAQNQQANRQQNQNQNAAPNGGFGAPGASYLTTAPAAPAAPGADEDAVPAIPGLAPVTGAGSATGSTAYPVYSNTAPSTTTETTVQRVTTQTPQG
jgi:hypothetical protein